MEECRKMEVKVEEGSVLLRKFIRHVGIYGLIPIQAVKNQRRAAAALTLRYTDRFTN
jgi:hypothetical protein